MSAPAQAPTKNRKPRLRAALACCRCHEKKTKCDLQALDGASCSNCKDAGASCSSRPSMRNRTRGNGNRPSWQPTGNLSRLRGSAPMCPSASFHGTTTSPLHVSATHSSKSIGASAAACRGQLSTIQSPPRTQNVSPDVDNVIEPDNRHAVDSYLGDAGYMSMFGPIYSRRNHDGAGSDEERHDIEPLRPALKCCYVETFLTYCSTFCPILDQNLLETAGFADLQLLEQALALVGTIIQPPLLGAQDPAVHYRCARDLFNSGPESHPIASLIAIMLFYWWSTESPNVVSKNGTWFWTGIAIRQAQEVGLHSHRQPRCSIPGDSSGLRRRIWWTLYARERLTSISQGRPTVIRLKDCDIPKPSIVDFPAQLAPRAPIFIQWVELCEIVGRVAKHLRRHPRSPCRGEELLQQLKNWTQNLPQELQLSFIQAPTASAYHRDICQLHLPYFAALILLDMQKRAELGSTSHILSVLSASCIAHIFESFLIRGSLRFLQGMSGWYATVALLALISARHIQAFRSETQSLIGTLQIALKDMAFRWPSSKMFDQGIEQLLAALPSSTEHLSNTVISPQTPDAQRIAAAIGIQQLSRGQPASTTFPATDVQAAMSYFPGVTPESDSIFTKVLTLTDPVDFRSYHDDIDATVFDLFNTFTYPLDSFGDLFMPDV